MFKHQNLFWPVMVVWNFAQGMACQLSPMACGAVPRNSALSPYCNSPFLKLINEQGKFDGTQKQVPSLRNSGLSPYCNSPFVKFINEQGSFDGAQNRVPCPTLFPCGSNGLMDFSYCGPCDSPTFGCPPFCGSLWGPFGPAGNRWPMLMGFNMANENGNFHQRVCGDPSASSSGEQNSGCEARCEETQQSEKAKQCSTKYRTTEGPCRRMRNKMLC